MTKIQTAGDDQIDRAHEERLQRCAELGQVVRRSKADCLAHYNAIVVELQHEAATDVHA